MGIRHQASGKAKGKALGTRHLALGSEEEAPRGAWGYPEEGEAMGRASGEEAEGGFENSELRGAGRREWMSEVTWLVAAVMVWRVEARC